MSHITSVLTALHKVKHENVPLKDIPEKHRSPSVITAALKKDPHALDFLTNEMKETIGGFVSRNIEARRLTKSTISRMHTKD